MGSGKIEVEWYQRCEEIMDYDPATGVLTYKQKYLDGNRTNPVGTKKYRANGRPKCVSVGRYFKGKKKSLTAHRIAWFIHTGGQLPENEVDHINRNPFDNRWANLADATSRQQKENRTDQSKHGVGVQERHGRYRSEVTINRKKFYLGTYDLPEQASRARVDFLNLKNQGLNK